MYTTNTHTHTHIYEMIFDELQKIKIYIHALVETKTIIKPKLKHTVPVPKQATKNEKTNTKGTQEAKRARE